MLKYRICAHCGSQIESSSALFCYHCGELLDQLTEEKKENQTLSSSSVKSTSGLRHPARAVGLIIIVIIFLITASVALILSGGLNWARPPKNVGSAVLLKNFFYATAEQTWEKPLLSEVIPDNTGFFLFGSDAKAFLEKLLTPDQINKFQSLTGLNLEEAQSYLSTGFGFFGDQLSWGFLTQVKSPDFIRTKIMEAAQKEQLEASASVIADYLLISNSPETAAAVSETIARKHLSLSLKAGFVEAWRSSAHKAQYFLYARDEQNLGEALVRILGSEIGQEVKSKIKGQAVLIKSASEGTILQGGPGGQ